jgi:AcrR family transcriptional regulator
MSRNGHLAPAGISPATAPRRRKRNRVGKQRALIHAALKLFAARGYDATTTREIAACAGCAEGLIHRYFNGKSGLLLALMSAHASQEVKDLSTSLPTESTLEAEIQQIVNWEVDRMWRDRDMFRVTIPHAILDPKVGKFVSKVGPQRHAKAIAERLRRHQGAGRVSNRRIEAISNAIGAMGFIFGFMRPAVLGQDRKQAAAYAAEIAGILSRGLVAGN